MKVPATLSILALFSIFGSGIVLAQAPAITVATVAGEPVSAEDLDAHIKSQIRQLRNQEYEIKSKALDELITQRIVEAEARKKGLTLAKLLAEEVDRNIPDPSLLEVEAFYLGQRDRINRPFEQVRAQVAQSLKQARLVQARQEYGKRLREKTDVVVLLHPPRTDVAADPKRMRGPANATVQIVEFSDFQCPFCQRAQTAVKDVLAKYGDRVSLSFRDFPLRELHPNAQRASEAANCAAEQGKFWQFHDKLFEDQNKLDQQSLLSAARSLGLDGSKFEACVTSGKYKNTIERDLSDGAAAGVTGTPAFFVNGVFLNGAVPVAEFEKVIDAELAAARHKDTRATAR